MVSYSPCHSSSRTSGSSQDTRNLRVPPCREVTARVPRHATTARAHG